jgi:hypothetical protein
MNNPNKAFGAHEKDFYSLLINRKCSEKMRIISRKFSEGFGQLLNAFLKPFCTQAPLDASA